MSEARGLVAAGLTGVQVGLAIVATRALLGDAALGDAGAGLGPISLAALRYGVALAVLVPVCLARPWVAVARRDLVPMMALGIGQFGVLIALLNWGLARVPASRGALIFACFPLLTLALAAALGREAISARKLGGVALSIIGVALTLGEGLFTAEGGSLAGGLAVLAAAAVGAVCAVFYRPYLLRYPVVQVGTLAMASAFAVLVIFALPEAPWRAVAALPGWGWAVVLYIGLSSGVGYLLWLTALRLTTPTRATVLLGLSPVTAALVGVGLLGEAPSIVLWLGLGTVLAGAILASRGGQEALAIGGGGR